MAGALEKRLVWKSGLGLCGGAPAVLPSHHPVAFHDFRVGIGHTVFTKIKHSEAQGERLAG